MKWKDLDMKIKLLLSFIALFTFVGSAGATVYKTFAKETEFRQFVAGYQFDKDKENYFFYDKKVSDCIRDYGENFERATQNQREDCLWFRAERDIIKDKLKRK